MQIHSYLTFNGNCREAMSFYQDCLGGDLVLQTIGDSPLSKKMPKKMKNCILHATLKKETFVLHGSDIVPHTGLIKGNAVSFALDCSGEEELKRIYSKLSTNSKINHPIQNTFWGALFGGLTDKYGHHWLLNYNKENTH